MSKIKGTERYFQHICATCWRKDQTKIYHPESDEICPHQGAWLNVYRNRGSKSALFKQCSSKLNPLADVFLPSFIKNELVEEKVDLTLLDKCSQFCSKHKGELYDDVSINIHNTIDIQDDKKQ